MVKVRILRSFNNCEIGKIAAWLRHAVRRKGERRERCRGQMQRPERVAAVCVQRSPAVGKAHTGNRNRTRLHLLPRGADRGSPTLSRRRQQSTGLLHLILRIPSARSAKQKRGYPSGYPLFAWHILHNLIQCNAVSLRVAFLRKRSVCVAFVKRLNFFEQNTITE